MEKNVLYRSIATPALAGLSLLALTACATVSPEDMESELSQLRAEMRQSEERVEQLEGRVDEVEQRAEQRDQRMNELEQSLSGMRNEFGGQIERMEESIRFNAPVYFEFDDANVRDQDRAILDRFAQVVQEYYPDAIITVEGFTDPVGPPEYNVWLGQERADAVREYLVGSGLADERVRSVSYGMDNLRLIVPAQGGPSAGWQNRRVTLVIDHGERVDGSMEEDAFSTR
jgi:peptidoglycan-associated lipoprotein